MTKRCNAFTHGHALIYDSFDNTQCVNTYRYWLIARLQ